MCVRATPLCEVLSMQLLVKAGKRLWYYRLQLRIGFRFRMFLAFKSIFCCLSPVTISMKKTDLIRFQCRCLSPNMLSQSCKYFLKLVVIFCTSLMSTPASRRFVMATVAVAAADYSKQATCLSLCNRIRPRAIVIMSDIYAALAFAAI
jgi:hypothetical protein